MEHVREAWVVYTNTDLTEGRGIEYPLFVCQIQSTAYRLAKGRYVQGTNAPVKVFLITRDVTGQWLGPINLIGPTAQDTVIQRNVDENNRILKEKDIVLEKAKALGLTDADIKLLKM